MRLAEVRLVEPPDVAALAGRDAMALHLAMLESGADLLLLHTWTPPALSLGRFQDVGAVDFGRAAADGVDVVCRPTGGGAILHDGDLTYAVTLPSTGRTRDDYTRVAGALAAGLATLGVDAHPVHAPPGRSPVCFAAPSGSDLRAAGGMVCGSAQLRRRGRFLQHGSIPLDARAFQVDRYVAGVGPAHGATLDATPMAAAAALRAGFEARFGPLLRPSREVEVALESTLRVCDSTQPEPSSAAVGLWRT